MCANNKEKIIRKDFISVGDKVITPLQNIVGEIIDIKADIATIKIKKQWSGQQHVSERKFKLHIDTLIKCDETYNCN